MDRNDMPVGFAFVLSMNPEAMKAFSALPQSKQHEVLQKAHTISSENEMRSLVNSLSPQQETS